MADKAKTAKSANGSGTSEDGVVTIKKYANRRLYNTATSSYVTLDHLCQMVKDDVDFVVYDAKTGDDITRSVLTQIIVEEEAKGQNMLPISFLRQLISLYGDNLQMVVPRYLETSMATFAENQERMRDYIQDALGGMYSFGNFEDMAKSNLTMFDQAMKMFQPGAQGNPAQQAQQQAPAQSQAPAAAGGDQTADAVKALQNQLAVLQNQLNALGTQNKG